MAEIRVNSSQYKIYAYTEVNHESGAWVYRTPLLKNTLVKRVSEAYGGKEISTKYDLGSYDLDNLKQARAVVHNFFDWFGRGICSVQHPANLTDDLIYGPGYVDSTYKCATMVDSTKHSIESLLKKENILDNNRKHDYQIHIPFKYLGYRDSISIKIDVVPDTELTKREQAIRANRARRRLLEKSRKHMAKKLVAKDNEIAKLRSEIKTLKNECSGNK